MLILFTEYLIILMLNFTLKNVNNKLFYFLTSIILSVTAFFCVPQMGSDLYNHYKFLNQLRIGGWEVAKMYYYYKSLPIYVIYFYLISRQPFNGLLPAITFFVVYSCLFKIILMASEDFKLDRKYEKISFVFILSTISFLSLSGIRNFLAYAIFAFFIYNELVRNKYRKICWIFYIALCFFHTSIIMLVIFRIILLIITNEFSKKMILLLILFWAFCQKYILAFLSHYTNIEVIRIVLSQFEYYTTKEYTEPISVLTKVATLLLLVCILIYMNNKQSIYKTKKLSQYVTFFEMLVVFAISSINDYNFFERTTTLINMMSTPLLMLFIANKTMEVAKSKNKKSTNGLFFLLLIFAWECIFGNLAYLFYFHYRYVYFY